jgi:hypothetical protein
MGESHHPTSALIFIGKVLRSFVSRQPTSRRKCEIESDSLHREKALLKKRSYADQMKAFKPPQILQHQMSPHYLSIIDLLAIVLNS